MICEIKTQDIIKTYKKYNKRIPIPSAELLLSFLKNKRYHNIIYEFDVIAMHILIKILEKKNCYEDCIVLKESIEKHNKLTENNYKTTL